MADTERWFYVVRDGEERGPYRAAQLRDLVARGSLDATTEVRPLESRAARVTVAAVLGLASQHRATAVTPAADANPMSSDTATSGAEVPSALREGDLIRSPIAVGDGPDEPAWYVARDGQVHGVIARSCG